LLIAMVGREGRPKDNKAKNKSLTLMLDTKRGAAGWKWPAIFICITQPSVG